MISEIDKYASVFLTSMFRFTIGPLVGVYQNLSITEATVFTILGGMTTIVVITLAGEKIRKYINQKFFKKKKLFTTRTRRRVRFMKKYGLKGVAFLTPVLFGPIIGTLLAVTLGESKKKVVMYMLASSSFWAVCLSLFFHHSSILFRV
jgi:hypothetical protein